MEKAIAEKTISVNEEGFLTELSQWDKSVAEALALENNITLAPKHWEVIAYLQDQFRNDIALTIRRVGNSGVTNIKEFYQLFPPAPLKLAAKISGIPKPASCI